MTFESFLQTLALELKDGGADHPSRDTIFRDLPFWSSMMALIVVSKIDEVYHVAISNAELASLHTLGELYSLLLQKLETNT